MPSGVWLTPVQQQLLQQQKNLVLEKLLIPPPKVDLEHEIHYFSDRIVQDKKKYYDRFFEFTRPFPLFDRRKTRDNRHFLPDIWYNIYEQEKSKAVPACMSHVHGHRPPYDSPGKDFCKRDEMSSFYRRRNIFPPIEKEVKETTCGH